MIPRDEANRSRVTPYFSERDKIRCDEITKHYP
jgi:hypothetical protein